MGEDIRCFYLNVNIRTVKNSCDKDIDIVSGLLPFPDDSLYLRCLTNNLSNKELAGRLADDYSAHREQDIYINYLEQVTVTNNQKKGDKTMVCEGLLILF